MLTTGVQILLMRIHWKWLVKPTQKCQRCQLMETLTVNTLRYYNTRRHETINVGLDTLAQYDADNLCHIPKATVQRRL